MTTTHRITTTAAVLLRSQRPVLRRLAQGPLTSCPRASRCPPASTAAPTSR